MKKQIRFITGNPGKIATLKRFLQGTGLSVISSPVRLVEIQASTVEEIVRQKALDALNHVDPPFVVHDSGVFVKALGGFPGPYAKYVEETFGQRRLTRVLAAKDDRSCTIVKSLVYVDSDGNTHVFNHELHGRLAQEPYDSQDASSHWSSLYTIFIPDGWDKPLAAFTQLELKAWEETADGESEFAQLRHKLLAPN